jgi:hypothetical protein
VNLRLREMYPKKFSCEISVSFAQKLRVEIQSQHCFQMQQKCSHVYFNLNERKTYKYVLETKLWRILTYSFPKISMKLQAANSTYSLSKFLFYLFFCGNSEIQTMHEYNV